MSGRQSACVRRTASIVSWMLVCTAVVAGGPRASGLRRAAAIDRDGRQARVSVARRARSTVRRRLRPHGVAARSAVLERLAFPFPFADSSRIATTLVARDPF